MTNDQMTKSFYFDIRHLTFVIVLAFDFRHSS